MAEYFVKNGGSDAAAGTSDGTAWATIAKVNSVTLNAGDIVNFKRGSRFEDASLTRALVGASGNPLTFRAYGSDLTIYPLSVWTNSAGTVWWAPLRFAPSAVFDDGVPLTAVASLAAVVAGRYFYDRERGRLYLTTPDSSTPVNDLIEVHVLRPPIIAGGPEVTGWTEIPDAGGGGENFLDETGGKLAVAWWMFENSLTGNGATSAAFTASGAITYNTSLKKQGSASLSVSKVGPTYVTVPIASLPTGFPLKNHVTTTGFTFCGWVQFVGGTIAENDAVLSLLRLGNSGGFVIRVRTEITNKVLWIQFPTGSPAGIERYATIALTPDTWYHWAVVWTGTVVRFYVNGTQQGADQTWAPTVSIDDAFELGAITQFGFTSFSLHDEVVVFDVPLTTTEINSIITNGVDGGGAPAHWSADLSSAPINVCQDEYRYLTPVGGVGSLTINSWYHDVVLGKLHIRTADDDDPATHLIEAQVRHYSMLPSACSHFTLEDVTLLACANDGWLGPATTANLIMRRVVSRANFRYGIYFGFSESAGTPLGSITCEDCEAYYNGATGLAWGVFFTGPIVIRRATASYNSVRPEISWTAGIRTAPADFSGNITVEDCVANYNGTLGVPGEETGYGIWLDSTGVNCLVRRCSAKGNQYFGIDIEQVVGTTAANGCVVTGCVAQKNLGGGLTIRTGSHFAKAFNNTLYDNSGNNLHFVNTQTSVQARNNVAVRGPSFPTARNLAVRNGAETGLMLSHNCFGPEASGFIDWEASILSTYDAAEVEYGGTLASIESDPQLIDPENGDFRIRLSSLLRDRGIDVALPYFGRAPDVGMEELPPAVAAGAMGLGI